MINNQDFFDKTVRHFKAQGVPARNHDLNRGPGCMYRTPEGLKCAVGCHIPDELYVSAMECGTVHSLLRHFPILHEYIPNRSLAADLQIVHDNVNVIFDHKVMVTELTRVAVNYGLTNQVVLECFGSSV